MTDPTVHHLRAERGLSVPPEDEPLLEGYWDKMRRLRAQVDEDLLADAEIAVTWSATGEDRR
jgi:hypothetical protein